eukprot:scaffold921_cov101-Isochrysis_galbana.AAC.6
MCPARYRSGMNQAPAMPRWLRFQSDRQLASSVEASTRSVGWDKPVAAAWPAKQWRNAASVAKRRPRHTVESPDRGCAGGTSRPHGLGWALGAPQLQERGATPDLAKIGQPVGRLVVASDDKVGVRVYRGHCARACAGASRQRCGASGSTIGGPDRFLHSASSESKA